VAFTEADFWPFFAVSELFFPASQGRFPLGTGTDILSVAIHTPLLKTMFGIILAGA
jgi:hypothetical protein